MGKREDRLQAERDFESIVAPLLRQHHWNDAQISAMLPRIEWTRNHANWTCRMADRYPNDVPEIEQAIRNVWTGGRDDRLVIQAYLKGRGRGPVVSYGIIRVEDMARLMHDRIGCYDRQHPYELVPFRCLLFHEANRVLPAHSCTVFELR